MCLPPRNVQSSLVGIFSNVHIGNKSLRCLKLFSLKLTYPSEVDCDPLQHCSLQPVAHLEPGEGGGGGGVWFSEYSTSTVFSVSVLISFSDKAWTFRALCKDG